MRRPLRFSILSLMLATAAFGAILAVYRVGYIHGVADEVEVRRTNRELENEIGILRTWWFVAHPDEPLPATLPPAWRRPADNRPTPPPGQPATSPTSPDFCGSSLVAA